MERDLTHIQRQHMGTSNASVEEGGRTIGLDSGEVCLKAGKEDGPLAQNQAMGELTRSRTQTC